MKFFADTASLKEIEECFLRKVNDGITTNPKIMETSGDLSLGFEGACKGILSKYPIVPVSLETDLRGIDISQIDSRVKEVKETLLDQAYKISKWGKNVVIKIPFCKGGLEATRELNSQNIQTNVTACMLPYQALLAAEAGATYVSLFANRMLDSKIIELAGYNTDIILNGDSWKKIINDNNALLSEKAWEIVLGQIAYVAQKLDGTKTELIIGSIRKPHDIERIVQAGPQVITIPYKITQELERINELKNTKRTIAPNDYSSAKSIFHPMTKYTLEEFEKSAESYRQKN